jgi:hypothetical protein
MLSLDRRSLVSWGCRRWRRPLIDSPRSAWSIWVMHRPLLAALLSGCLAWWLMIPALPPPSRSLASMASADAAAKDQSAKLVPFGEAFKSKKDCEAQRISLLSDPVIGSQMVHGRCGEDPNQTDLPRLTHGLGQRVACLSWKLVSQLSSCPARHAFEPSSTNG